MWMPYVDTGDGTELNKWLAVVSSMDVSLGRKVDRALPGSHDDAIKWKHLPRYRALCEGNPSVTDGFPSQRPVTRSFDAFFDLCLNKRSSKQSRRRWFETQSLSLWRHYNAHPLVELSGARCQRGQVSPDVDSHLLCSRHPVTSRPKELPHIAECVQYLPNLFYRANDVKVFIQSTQQGSRDKFAMFCRV